MRTPNEIVAANVSGLRRERNLSLSELARRAGIAKGTIAKLELGAANPTIDTLYAVAAALEVPVTRLVSEGAPPTAVQRASDAAWTTDGGARARALGKVYGSGLIQVFLLEVDSGGRAAEAHPAGTLEHIYVLQGKARIGPVGAAERVGPGDFVRFPADRPHVYQPTGNGCLLHVVVSIPVPPEGGPLELGSSRTP